MARKRKESDVHNPCYIARIEVGPKGVTQERFAELTGVHETIIARRETGKLKIKGTAKTLYDLIYSLGHDNGLGSEIEETLAAIDGDRSEDRALLALFLLASDKGKLYQVRKAMGDEVNEEEEDMHRELNVDNSLRVLTGIRKSLEKEARRLGPKGERHRSAAKTFAAAEYEMKLLRDDVVAGSAGAAGPEPGGGEP